MEQFPAAKLDGGQQPRLHMLTLWVLTDGKRGHENQSLGLAEAIARKARARLVMFPVKKSLDWLGNWLIGRFPGGQKQPRPDLIIATGHSTHYALLAARRAFGGKAVVLMKPSLPLSWFDMVILPRHDGLKAGPNRLISEGPLNRIRADQDTPRKGNLILVGGPSPHFDWKDKRIVEQITELVLSDHSVPWTLTTSRRTPVEFLSALQASSPGSLTVIPHEQTDPAWLPDMLTHARTVWVTPDSASMIYEALTAGAGVGLFDLPSRQTRVAASLQELVEKKLVTPFSLWKQQHYAPPATSRFNEADRIAGEILKWLKRS